MSAKCERVFSFAKHLVTNSCNCLKAAAKKDSNAQGNVDQVAGKGGEQEGRAMRVTRTMRMIRMMRTMRTIRARRKIRAMRKTVLNISLLTIDCNSTPCQAQYIKYHLVGTGSELQMGYWLVTELKFVTNQTSCITGMWPTSVPFGTKCGPPDSSISK